MMIPSTSVNAQGSRRKRRRSSRSPSAVGNGATATPNRPEARAILDVVVVRGNSLLHVRARASVIARIDQLARRTDRTRPRDRGPWVLVLTSTNLQAELGRQLSRVLTRCQGTLVVTEGSQENSARAALALHRLHFPSVLERERAARILVLGSARERELLCDRPPAQTTGDAGRRDTDA